jgi:hypothetical protein
VFKKRWFMAGVVTLSALDVFGLSMVFAQHGPRRHRPESTLAYDTNSEATFKGIVAHVKGGPSLLSRVFQFHTLGLGHKGVQEKQLLLKTDTDTVQIHLGPTAFLTENNVEIRKGDTLEVTGSRVTVGDAQVILARAIRKDGNEWTLRDATGHPLWRPDQAETRGFWTTKKVLLTVVAVKVALLATVLRH